MKLTYENCDKLRLTRKGTFNTIGNHNTVVYKECCTCCGEPFLAQVTDKGNFCSHTCANAGEHNPSYKGDVVKLKLPLYNTYKQKLGVFEKVRPFIQNDVEVIQVQCHNTSCMEWYTPTFLQVQNRLLATEGLNRGECNFYCSPECKMECSTFGRIRYFRGHKDIIRTYTRHELKIWAREVLRRYDFTCACCGDRATIGHHRKSKIEFPEFALDPTFGTALCKWCHIYIFHSGKNSPVHYIDKCR